MATPITAFTLPELSLPLKAVGSSGCKMAFAKGTPLFSLPPLTAPFGSKKWDDGLPKPPNGGGGERSSLPKLVLSIDDPAAQGALEQLEAAAQAWVTQHSAEVLGGQKTLGIVTALGYEVVKPGKDNYPPTLTLKLGKDAPDIPPRSVVTADQVAMRGVWVAGGRWGISLIASHLSIQKADPRAELAEYAFLD
ncbi:MAG: hypothetical protein ACRER5_22985 [Pseudomonas sp.]